jgi:RNA ligase (TIGR02306 family)
MSSLSTATVVEIPKIERHPDADRLGIVDIEGCPAIVGLGEFNEGDTAVWCPFDLVLPDSEEIPEFIRGKRVRPARLRGIFSMGVLLPNKWEFELGEDVTDRLGITKWEPLNNNSLRECNGERDGSGHSGREISGPSIPKYDIESLRKYHDRFEMGEEVVIHEKLDGENFRVVSWDDEIFVGSRNRWIAEGDNQWWNAARQCGILEVAPRYNRQVFFGECYGNLARFKYDTEPGERKVRFFDIFDGYRNVFNDYEYMSETLSYHDLEQVPLLYTGGWIGFKALEYLAEGQSTIGGHIREGFVVRTAKERYSHRLGRMMLKLHGMEYLIYRGKMK